MRAILICGALVVSACADDGGGGSTPPPGLDFEGTLTITVGTETFTPTSGAVVKADDPTKMLIVVSSLGVSCTTQNPPGTAFVAEVPAMAGTHDTLVGIWRSKTHYNGTTGTLTIDAVGDRVTGSVAPFTTTDNAGEPDEIELGASGSFDVTSCL